MAASQFRAQTGRMSPSRTPPGCGREHFAAVAEVYRQLLERWGQQKRPRRVTEVKAVPRLDATPAKPRRQRTPRRPTLASVAKQANKAALDVARYEVKPDGTVVIITGSPELAEPENPWPLDEFRMKETSSEKAALRPSVGR
jgi:hypothetical protein